MDVDTGIDGGGRLFAAQPVMCAKGRQLDRDARKYVLKPLHWLLGAQPELPTQHAASMTPKQAPFPDLIPARIKGG
jgi:hypothetical protein